MGSVSLRFWNAAFFRENTCTAVLYPPSVFSQICRRISAALSSVGSMAYEPMAPPMPLAKKRELSNG